MPTTIKSENWESVTTPAIPSGWNVGTSIVTDATYPHSGANSLAYITSTNGNVPAAIWNATDGNSGNCRASHWFRFDSSNSSYIQVVSLFLRKKTSAGTDVSTSSRYEFQVVRTSTTSGTLGVNLIRTVGGTQTELAGVNSASIFTDGIYYYLQGQCNGASGTALSIRVQRSTDNYWLNASGSWVSDPTNTTYCINFTDTNTSLDSAGYAGVQFYTSGGTGQTRSDDFLFESLSSTTSFTVSPTTVATGSTTALTATGSNTSWTTGTTFSVSGGTGPSIAARSVNAAAQTATFNLSSGSAAGTLTISDSTDAATASVGVANVIAPNNTAILYSPYNWQVTGTSARTNNPGAYLRTLVANTANVSVGIDTTLNGGNYPEIAYRVDGGPVQFASASASVAISITNRAQWTLIEVWVEAAITTVDRWDNPTSSLTFTGLTLDSGGTVMTPARRRYNLLWYGDSITEGADARGTTEAYPSNSATGCHPLRVAEMLDAEVGVVAFAGLGLTYSYEPGTNVPYLPLSYAYLWSGVSRSFTSPTQPDLIVINYGTNDAPSSDSTVTMAMGQVLSGLLGATTSSKIAVLRPFNGTKATPILAAVTAAGSSRVSYQDTTGIYTPSTTTSLDGIHPVASWHSGIIAPSLAPMLSALLTNTGAGSSPTTLTIHEADGTTAATNFECWVTSDSAGLFPVTGIQTTNSGGQVTFNLTTGTTYYLRGHGGGYQIGGTTGTPAVSFVA